MLPVTLIFLSFLFHHLDNEDPWKIHTIDNFGSGADGVKLGDINGDGLPDIVTGWEESGITKLYLNPGKGKVKEKWPLVTVGNTPNVEDAVFVDMNGDGMLDIVSCTEGKTRKIFVQFAPKNNLLDSAAWQQSVLPASAGRMMWMYAEPLQLDGKNGIDLIAAGKNENSQIGWFEAPEDGGDLAQWQWHPISSMGWAMSIILRDMNSDGNMDIVVSDRRDKLRGCRWLENPGPGEGQKKPWKNHDIGGQNAQVMFMTMGDVDLDGNEEAMVTDYDTHHIYIFKRQNDAGTKWSEKVYAISEETGTGKSVEVGDVNGDGTPDLVLSANTHNKNIIGLGWIDGKTLAESDMLHLQPISRKDNYKYDRVRLLDIDQDSDLDILICEENNGAESRGLGVVWYENPLK